MNNSNTDPTSRAADGGTVTASSAYLKSFNQNHHNGDECKAANMSSWEIAISERMTQVHQRLLTKLGED